MFSLILYKSLDSDDHIVFLSDWFHVTSHEKFSNLLYGNVTFALESENILINGKGLSEYKSLKNNKV